MKKDDFSDILNAQGFTSSNASRGGSNAGASLKELKNEAEYVEMDPVKRAVSRLFLLLSKLKLKLSKGIRALIRVTVLIISIANAPLIGAFL